MSTIATTRPETLLGDTAVAVHPDDERYKNIVGKMLILPLVGRRIPVVADEYVERDFGTGCVKITPAHDPNDFEVGKRHGLEVLDMLTDDAKITDDYPAYAGMDRYEARKKIVADLEEQGCLISVEDHVHNVGHLLPLRNHCRAEGFASVVRQNGAACDVPRSTQCATAG